jgi:hypothetical protein
MPRYVILQYYTCHRREGIANVSRMCRTLRALCKYILHGAKYQKQCMISTPARASPIRRILHRMFRKSFFPSRLPGEQLVKNEGYLGGHRCRAGRIRTEEKKQSALDRTYRTFALRSRLCVFSTHRPRGQFIWHRRTMHLAWIHQMLSLTNQNSMLCGRSCLSALTFRPQALVHRQLLVQSVAALVSRRSNAWPKRRASHLVHMRS